MYIKISGEISKILSNVANKRKITMEEALDFVIKSFSERTYYSQILLEEKIELGVKGHIPKSNQPAIIMETINELSKEDSKRKKNYSQALRILLHTFYQIDDVNNVDSIIENYNWGSVEDKSKTLKKIFEYYDEPNRESWGVVPRSYQDIEYVKLFDEISKQYSLSKMQTIGLLVIRYKERVGEQ